LTIGKAFARAIRRRSRALKWVSLDGMDRPSPLPELPMSAPSLFTVAVFTFAILVPLTSGIAYGLMFLWVELQHGDAVGLERAGLGIVAGLCWIVLSAFSLVSGIAMAQGLLGRRGKVSPVAWVLIAICALGGGVCCFKLGEATNDVLRGTLGLFSESISFIFLLTALSYARDKGAEPPD
jgi:hypothetical protein